MPKFEIDILDQTFIVDYTTRITSKPFPGRGPDLSQPGEPPEPGEFDVEIVSLRYALPYPSDRDLEVPVWLRNRLVAKIVEDDTVYHEAFSGRHECPEPDAAYDAMRDQRPTDEVPWADRRGEEY